MVMPQELSFKKVENAHVRVTVHFTKIKEILQKHFFFLFHVLSKTLMTYKVQMILFSILKKHTVFDKKTEF